MGGGAIRVVFVIPRTEGVFLFFLFFLFAMRTTAKVVAQRSNFFAFVYRPVASPFDDVAFTNERFKWRHDQVPFLFF